MINQTLPSNKGMRRSLFMLFSILSMMLVLYLLIGHIPTNTRAIKMVSLVSSSDAASRSPTNGYACTSGIDDHSAIARLIEADRLTEAFSALDASSVESWRKNLLEWKLGWALFQDGDTDRAVKTWSKLGDHKSDLIARLQNDAASYTKHGDAKAAEQCYEALLGLEPRSARRHLDLAEHHVRQGAKDTAASVLRRGAAYIQPPDAAYFIGRAEELGGNWAGAVSYYRDALESAENSAQAHYRLAFLLAYRLGGVEEAIGICQRSVSITPDFYASYQLLGLLYIATDKPTAAMEWLQLGVSRIDRPSYRAQLRMYLGYVYLEQCRIRDAGSEFEAALIDNPYEQRAWRGLALARSRAHEWQKALDAYQRALELSEEQHAAAPASWHVEYGTILEHLGYLDKALAAYEHACALDPDLEQTKERLGHMTNSESSNP